MGISFKTNFLINGTQKLITKRGLGIGQEVQRFVDSEVLRLTDPYVPFDSGKLKESGTIHTKIGSGKVIYKTPYARRQYFSNKGNGLRGRQWFHRMKADRKDEILKGAAQKAGAKI